MNDSSSVAATGALTPLPPFAREHERYAALVLARLRHAPKPMVAAAFAGADVRRVLGLPDRDERISHLPLDPDEVECAIEVLERRAGQIAGMGGFESPVFRNAEALGRALGFTQTEGAIMALAVLTDATPLLHRVCADLTGHLRDRDCALATLASMLDAPPEAVAEALAPTRTPVRSGMIWLNLRESCAPFLQVQGQVTRTLFDATGDPGDIIQHFVAPTPQPCLTVDDYEHLRTDVAILAALLEGAAARREPGLNVLLYGPTGTGKTELARVVAAAAGLRLYGVRHSDHEVDNVVRACLSELTLAQELLRAVPGIALLFDEADDLLPEGATSFNRIGKAAINERLETNPVPTVWICNRIDEIDPAYRRRFAFTLEVRMPGRGVRRRIALRAFRGLGVDPACIEVLADGAEVSPGQIVQAARVAGLVRESVPIAAVAQRTLEHSTRALGQRAAGGPGPALGYDLRYVNCGTDGTRAAARLADGGRGTVLLWGPPGTGKTAFAHHVAATADRPLLVKTASSLRSPWVGESERNIAAAFTRAGEEGAILLFDEVDSFLADRCDARARWETTETNEFLSQMERFDGLLFATTNLLDRLDRAALRRFALKLRFDYLRPEQAVELVLAALAALGVPTPHRAEVAAGCANLGGVSAGDVAQVVQRHRLLGTSPSPAEFLATLREELSLRGNGSGQRIGF